MKNLITICVTTADISGLLSGLNRKGIRIENVSAEDDLMICFQVSRKDYREIYRFCEHRGDIVKPIHESDLFQTGRRILQRPILTGCCVLLLLLTIFIPTRIFFVDVEGNSSVSDLRILEAAKSCGISFGVSRRQVRSEQMKNSLLSALPELQWAGINTNGCTATISVRERSENEQKSISTGISSIVASRDGVVFSCTATKGNALCKTGQAVKAGETLISGYTDCGISIRAEQAEGEVFAQTSRKLEVITPVNYTQKEPTADTKKILCLIIGKNRINFYKGSGISDTTCDKMYTQYDLILPGGFRLPVSIVVETWIQSSEGTTMSAAELGQDALKQYAQRYLMEQMISGSVLSENVSLESDTQTLSLYGEYMCLEMIGRVRNEEILDHYGKDN